MNRNRVYFIDYLYFSIVLFLLFKQRMLESYIIMRKILCFCIFFPVLVNAIAQVPAVKKYDSKKQHLLIKLSGMVVYSSNQGQIDLDSSMIIACQAQNLSRLLVFDENLQEGLYTAGRIALEKNDPASAEAILFKLKNKEQQDLLMLELAGFYLYKPGTEKSDLDEAYKYLAHAKALSDSIHHRKYQNESLNLLGKYYAEKGETEKSIDSFNKVVQATAKSGNKFELANALLNLGISLPPQNPDKLINLEKALVLFKSVDAKEKECETISNTIFVHFLSGEIDLTKKELFELLALQKSIGYLHIHYTNFVLSYISLLEGQKRQSLLYAMECIKSMESTKDTVLAAYFYLRVANIYEHTEQREKAIEWCQKTMMSCRKQEQLVWFKAFLTAAYLLSDDGKYEQALRFVQSSIKIVPPTSLFDKMKISELIGLCYNHLHKPQLSDHFYDEMVRYAEQLHSIHMDPDVARVYLNAANHYAIRNNFKKAQMYFDKSKFLPTSQYGVSWKLLAYETQFKIDSAKGNYVQAIKFHQNYNRMQDSLFNIKQNRQMQELQVQYETKEKEQDIKLLNKEKILQQDRLKQANTTKNLTFICVFALLLIVGLLYSRYRVKQRTNDLLESQKKEISIKNTSLENLLDEKEQILVEKDKLIVEKQDLIEEKVSLLDDKEWLLKEIHHRVKNNLQIIMSLLGSQTKYIGNDAALAIIRESQHRVEAISLIHQKLYQSSNMATIAMNEYIPELVSVIKDSFNTAGRIGFTMDIDTISLDVAQAVPIGLILNEAITNSIKHAFPDNRQGQVEITLQKMDPEGYKLTFQDNGIGLPQDFDIDKLNSLGMTLITGLSRQLEGALSIKNENGLLLKIIFLHDRLTPPILGRKTSDVVSDVV